MSLLLAALCFAAIATADSEGAAGATPSISGEARVGVTLTSGVFTQYRWQRCDPTAATCASGSGHTASGWSDITGAAQATYTLQAADAGLLVRVLTKNTSTGTNWAHSQPVGPILEAEQEPPPEPAPTIEGEPRAEETLQTGAASLYQWQRCDPEAAGCEASGDETSGWIDIEGATGPTYTLGTGDVGLLVRVLTKQNEESEEWGRSAPSGPIESAAAEAPVISGEAQVGETLQTTDGFAQYQWQRCKQGTGYTCAGDGGLAANGWSDIAGAGTSSYVLARADEGHLIRVLAKHNDTGSPWGRSEPVGPVQPATAPPPVFDRSGNVEPLRGTVLAKVPGRKGIHAIEDLTQVPLGTRIDVTEGRISLVTQRRPQGPLQETKLWGGAFILSQTKKNKITNLKLIDGFGGASASAYRGGEAETMRRRKGRKLWGKGKCRCRHRGRNSSGTARGTWWSTSETARGTRTTVLEGSVVVRDFKRKRKVVVKAGGSYLARSR